MVLDFSVPYSENEEGWEVSAGGDSDSSAEDLETFFVIFISDLVDSIDTDSSDEEDWSFLNKAILVLSFLLSASEEEEDWTVSDDDDSDSSWSFLNKTILAVGFLLCASWEDEDWAVSDDVDSDSPAEDLASGSVIFFDLVDPVDTDSSEEDDWSFLNKTILVLGFLLFASEEEEDWAVSDDDDSDSSWSFLNKTILAVGFLLFASVEEEAWTVSDDDDSYFSRPFLNKSIFAVGFLLFASEEEVDWAVSDDDDSDSSAGDLALGSVIFFLDLADPIDTDSSDEDWSFFNKTILAVGFLLFASEEEEDWVLSDDDDSDSSPEDLRTALVFFFFDLRDLAGTDSLSDVDGDFLNKPILVLVTELLDSEEGEDWELSVDDVSDSSVEDLSSSFVLFFLDLTDPTTILTIFFVWLLKR